MKQIVDFFIDVINHAPWLGPALSGGLVDYLTQVKRGSTRGTFTGILIHLVSAGFFGWLVGESVIALGYSLELYSVSCGVGGLLGTRVAEIAMFIVYRKIGK